MRKVTNIGTRRDLRGEVVELLTTCGGTFEGGLADLAGLVGTSPKSLATCLGSMEDLGLVSIDRIPAGSLPRVAAVHLIDQGEPPCD